MNLNIPEKKCKTIFGNISARIKSQLVYMKFKISSLQPLSASTTPCTKDSSFSTMDPPSQVLSSRSISC